MGTRMKGRMKIQHRLFGLIGLACAMALLAIGAGDSTKTNQLGLAPAAPTTHKIEWNGKAFPSAITIAEGDSIVITVRHKGDPGLFCPSSYPHPETIDGKSGDVLSEISGVQRLDPDTIQFKRYETKRRGQAQIVFTYWKTTEAAMTVTVGPKGTAAKLGPLVPTAPRQGPAPLPTKAARPAPPAELVVDMTKRPWPTAVNLTAGQAVVFDNVSAKVTITATDGKGALLERLPSGCGLTTRLRAVRQGSGEVTLAFRNGTTTTIKVNVAP
jgi:hypothetical protein